MRLYYKIDGGNDLLLADVLTNHSMSIDDLLYYADMDKVCQEQGWEGWNYDDLYVVAD
mgnify:CR=1 FL=1